MRILHISSARALGGGERHLADLANALAARGHDVHVALRYGSLLREQLAALPQQNIITVSLRNALNLGSALALARLIHQRQIEIVHAHMARDYPLAAFATRRAPNARLVITRHVPFPLSKIHAVTLSHVSRVIAVSRSVARQLEDQNIFPAHKISVIPNGLDLQRFDADAHNFSRDDFCRRLGIPADHLLIGTIGEINPLKGQEEFLRAAALIARRIASVDFIIAGEDTTRTGEHQAKLQRLIAELDLGERVHLTGWLADVAPLLHALDLFISASRVESFGLAIAEAMASGVPVVATATEGASEIIDDGVTGVLVPIDNVEELARAAMTLLTDAQERSRIGALARTAARERFSLERMVAATEQVYQEVMNAE